MHDKKNDVIDKIREYYRKRATTDKYATSPDFNLREIEINNISEHLAEGTKVLDVGCGNGFSTLCYATKINSVFIGVDFVPEMIEAANLLKKKVSLRGTVDFVVGDVLSLDFPDGFFDTVISQRCLLNLPEKDMQWTAMREIARVLKSGGIYLMMEGTKQGLDNLNTTREMFGLAPIPDADPNNNWFSNKFDEAKMLKVAERYFSCLEHIQRFGMYYFISRVIHPLLVSPERPRYDAPINAVARTICEKISNFDDLGHVALFVFRR